MICEMTRSALSDKPDLVFQTDLPTVQNLTENAKTLSCCATNLILIFPYSVLLGTLEKNFAGA